MSYIGDLREAMDFEENVKNLVYAGRRYLGQLLQQTFARSAWRSELVVKGFGKKQRGIGRMTRRIGFTFLTIKDNTSILYDEGRLRKTPFSHAGTKPNAL